jgi:hypothetical protein
VTVATPALISVAVAAVARSRMAVTAAVAISEEQEEEQGRILVATAGTPFPVQKRAEQPALEVAPPDKAAVATAVAVDLPALPDRLAPVLTRAMAASSVAVVVADSPASRSPMAAMEVILAAAEVPEPSALPATAKAVMAATSAVVVAV